jgi:putative transposase
VTAMNHDSNKPQRHSIRLRGYDYAQAGAYFITIVTKDRLCLFDEVVEGAMRLNELGRMVQSVWEELPGHYPGVQCDAFVVMPNHIHGIITLADNEAGGPPDVGAGLKPARVAVAVGPNSVRAGFKPAPTLPEVVRAFKTFSARRVNEIRNTTGFPLWQRNYYEHVVRSEDELHRIREYIANNPLQWELDRENPSGISDGTRRIGEPWEV